jgi:hypothetical protein
MHYHMQRVVHQPSGIIGRWSSHLQASGFFNLVQLSLHLNLEVAGVRLWDT